MDNKIEKLILPLKEKTLKGEANWNKTSDSGFQLILKNGSIKIEFFYHEFSGEDGIQILIFNGNGDLADRLGGTEGTDLYQEIYELLFVIKRMYYKADETIQSFFEELESGKTIGAPSSSEAEKNEFDD